MPAYTVATADARANFSRIANEVNRTGVPVMVFKNNRPWVVIEPAASDFLPNAEMHRAARGADKEARMSGRLGPIDELLNSLRCLDLSG
jgi:prevent-host-death family protein